MNMMTSPGFNISTCIAFVSSEFAAHCDAGTCLLWLQKLNK
jgi:hypothetical protein